MLWAILFVSLFLLWVVWAWWKSSGLDLVDYILGVLVTASVSAFLFVGGVVVACLIGSHQEEWTSQWTEETVKLVSLGERDGPVGGELFLGSGSFGSKDYYHFYKEVGEGYQAGKIPMGDNVTIFEYGQAEKDRAGQLKMYTLKFTCAEPSFWVYLSMPPPREKKYHFFIPPGSMKRSFILP